MFLLRTARRTFPGPPRFLPDTRAYFTDLTRGRAPHPTPPGHSYGEMAEDLIETIAPDPLDLLILTYSMHDLWPGRATATYLSHRCPGTPLSFALCDQGSAAPFTALRLIRDHAPHRALLIIIEQAALPYPSSATPPTAHRGVALLLGDTPGSPITALRQHPATSPDSVPALASTQIAELSAGRQPHILLTPALASVWPTNHEVVPTGAPTTGLWWRLTDALADNDLVIAADYDPDLRYLCLVAITSRP